ncbi:MaoC family dehydratase [Seohaeicola sp. SP36]|uniref:MaoC family dehydratase n=1 Tax=unclassified Seohaeicola TaxID=2641111 RepID=UPI00237A9F86|nr:MULTISPECIES: MaoC family dehydratase [unclassified Seohaeicola]MDD9709385.1 MaoC family dehydratase [Seohaeicola sp. 4SK31]MDD9737496.1 MaoC family dehydratase [Seohaeicola sp. SP36]
MTALYLEDFAVGQTFGTQVLTVTEEEIIRFAREFDPQPFHIDPALAQTTFFRGLAASGWHTAALTMRLLVGGDMTPAHGIIGAGFDSLTWPRPVRPSDTLQVLSEVLDVRRSRSRPTQGTIKLHSRTINQNDEVVQDSIGNLIIMAKSASVSGSQ